MRDARTVMHGGIGNPRWRGKRSRHSRCMRIPQFYVSGKRPIVMVFCTADLGNCTFVTQWARVCYRCSNFVQRGCIRVDNVSSNNTTFRYQMSGTYYVGHTFYIKCVLSKNITVISIRFGEMILSSISVNVTLWSGIGAISGIRKNRW